MIPSLISFTIPNIYSLNFKERISEYWFTIQLFRKFKRVGYKINMFNCLGLFVFTCVCCLGKRPFLYYVIRKSQIFVSSPCHSLTNGLKTHVNLKKQCFSSFKNEFMKQGAVVKPVNYFRRL